MGRADASGRTPRRRKRGYGDGSVHQDKNGQWWAAVYQNGKQRRFRCDSEQDAKAKCKEVLAQAAQGVDLGSARVTLTAWLETWLATVAAPNVKPKTLQTYHLICEEYIAPRIGSIKLTELQPAHVRRLLAQLKADGFSPRTVVNAYTVLRNALQVAANDRKLIYNPAASVERPKVPRTTVTPLTVSEAAALRWAVTGHRLRLLYDLCLSLGLRKGEALGIALNGIDLAAGTLTISQQVLDLAGKPSIERYTKNDTARTLPLSPRLIARVRERLEQLLIERGADGWQEHGLLFPSERGTPMSERNLDRHFKAAIARAQLRPLRFHWMRHSVASWLDECRITIETKAAILGHGSQGITGHYVHVPLSSMRAALDALEALTHGGERDAERARRIS